MHDLVHVSSVGSVLHRCRPAQHIITADTGCAVDDLDPALRTVDDRYPDLCTVNDLDPGMCTVDDLDPDLAEVCFLLMNVPDRF